MKKCFSAMAPTLRGDAIYQCKLTQHIFGYMSSSFCLVPGVDTTVPARHTSELKRLVRLSVGQYPGAQGA